MGRTTIRSFSSGISQAALLVFPYMKTLLKVLVILFIVLAVGIAGIYAYFGGFTKVEVTRGNFGPMEIIYKLHRGPYEELGKAWATFQAEWESAGLETCTSLSLYPDSPDTPKEQLRTFMACAIDDLDPTQKETLQEKFATFTIPSTEVVQGYFPYRNEASYFIGPMIVYPKIRDVMDKDGIEPVIAVEFYGVEPNIERIRYMMPVSLTKEHFAALLNES